MAVPAEPLTADPASEPPAIDGGEGEVFHPPLHVSQSDPALRSSELPNHQNITIWGRVGHVTEAQQEALRGIKRIHPDLTDREVGFTFSDSVSAYEHSRSGLRTLGERSNRFRQVDRERAVLAQAKPAQAEGPPPHVLHPILCRPQALRYLRARIFNVDKAVELLHASHEWRHLEKPWETDQAIIRPLFESGALSFATKLDQKRRPVMIIDPTTTGTADSETIVRCFQYSLEAAISQLEKGARGL